jgi:hypothetical protein
VLADRNHQGAAGDWSALTPALAATRPADRLRDIHEPRREGSDGAEDWASGGFVAIATVATIVAPVSFAALRGARPRQAVEA